MTKLSVNINKIATLRNSRGGDIPNVVEAALNAERFGAQGITVHPRPDQRHIRYQDVRDLKKVITTELNIEGNPIDKFIDLVLEVVPTQVTLVPDAHDAITSNAGWDTKNNLPFLREVVATFKAKGIRTSIFVDPKPEMIPYAAEAGADRVELYTEYYASAYAAGRSIFGNSPRGSTLWVRSQWRARSQPRKSALFRRDNSQSARSFDRTCSDFRCNLSRSRKYYSTLPASAEKIVQPALLLTDIYLQRGTCGLPESCLRPSLCK